MTVLLPTPPLPDKTSTLCLMPAKRCAMMGRSNRQQSERMVAIGEHSDSQGTHGGRRQAAYLGLDPTACWRHRWLGLDSLKDKDDGYGE